MTLCPDPVLAALGSSAVVALVFGFLLLRERKQTAATTREVERLAFYDVLTGLPNRLLFMDRASVAFAHAKRAGNTVAVAFLDLDRFKIVNDSLGHDHGDQVLRLVAKRLRDSLRETDTVARLGGDEFVLLLPDVRQVDDVMKVSSKILDVLRTPIEAAGREVIVTASIGVSLYPQDGADPETLMKNADAAMYRAKDRGGDSCEIYTPALTEEAMKALEMEGRLRRAVARQEFVLYYQPRVDISTTRVVAFEALLRWNDPERGLIMPREFIYAAEVSGLIVPIGQWVLQTACRQAKKWHDEGCHGLVVSVNLSQRQFHRHDLTDMIRDALRGADLEPQFLELEVDEVYVMTSAEGSMRILRDLKTLGVRVLISGFGAGYSSISYLRRFPIDGLKLDRSFLIGGNAEKRPLAVAALGMAKALSLKVIGEGVETQETADFLRSQSCDDIQGFLVSAAIPPQECERFIRFDPLAGGPQSGDFARR
jgi:diguanylate cyclase (GGDEF)-like protein